ncbi:hypothetical protein [Streptacidiphilus anmyonensis]|uniref:hypothetical protein n=1 Tax=Streptacidiphilus anmyonensis TaxID=405782 RepID=UPI0005A70CB9|nr:hypothetical protein [Streptacidiphilus anmyonensis]
MAGNYLAVLARAKAYVIRAQRTRAAVERMQARYQDRADSARYLAEGMTKLHVDEPTVTAYMEVALHGDSAAQEVGNIVSSADALSTAAQGLENETRASHSRMADANRTGAVQMADRAFIQRQ